MDNHKKFREKDYEKNNMENKVLNIQEYMTQIDEIYVPPKKNIIRDILLFFKSISWCKYSIHTYSPYKKYYKMEGHFTGNLRKTKTCLKCSKIVDVLDESEE